MNYSTIIRKKTGLIIMALSSSLFILGSFWYAGFATSNNWGLQLEIGMTFGIPAAIILFITIWHLKIGGFLAIAFSITFMYVWLLHLIGGDSDPRFIWSLFIITAIYLTGSILVVGNITKLNI